MRHLDYLKCKPRSLPKAQRLESWIIVAYVKSQCIMGGSLWIDLSHLKGDFSYALNCSTVTVHRYHPQLYLNWLQIHPTRKTPVITHTFHCCFLHWQDGGPRQLDKCSIRLITSAWSPFIWVNKGLWHVPLLPSWKSGPCLSREDDVGYFHSQ